MRPYDFVPNTRPVASGGGYPGPVAKRNPRKLPQQPKGLPEFPRLTDEAQGETGVSSEEFLASQAGLIGSLVATGRFPVFASVVADPELDVDLEVLFEFGLHLLLDGLEKFIARSHR